MQNKLQRQIGYTIFCLLSLFIFRVAAQFIQLIYPLECLPSFDKWQSGALPYPLLLFIQLLIIIFIFMQGKKFINGQVKINLRIGKTYLWLGLLYSILMLFRLLAGLTVAADHYWFSAKMPTFFHLVLAACLILIGYYHIRNMTIVNIENT